MLVHLLLKIIGASCLVSFMKVHGSVTEEQSALMPPLFHLDNFDRCMHSGENVLYCSITAQLAPVDPNKPSQSWKVIETVISTPKNFRRDRLRHGVCVPHSCPELTSNMSIYKNNYKLLREDLSTCYSKKYSDLGLKSTITDMHCETEEPHYDVDSLDLLVAMCLFTLFVIIIYATFYEGLARYKTEEEYLKVTSSPAGKILSCFSIPKNWKQLRSIGESPDAVALRGINGVRFINMMLVVMVHTNMVYFASPMVNPQFLENTSDNPIYMTFLNGYYAIQTYFLMSGWLLSYHFFLVFEKQKDLKFKYIVMAFVNRYIRLTPCVLVIIALNSTWVHHLSRGPVWNKLVGNEYRFCRKNWWSNLLYINNYYDSEHICAEQTWYVACDTQLFLVSLVIIMLMWKFQHRIKLILGTSVTIAVVITGLVNYINDYDIVLRQYPELLFNLLLGVPEFHEIYMSAHTNAGGYIIGLIFGYLFYKHRNQKILTNKFHITIWWILMFGLPISVVYIGIPIYQDDYQHSRILAAIYVALSKNVFVLGIAMMIFATSQGVGWFVRDVLTWLPFQTLGKLAFCAYLVHPTLIRIRIGLIREPNYLNAFIIGTQTLGDLGIAYIFAVILCLFVEMPVAGLQRLFVPQLKKTRTKNLDEKNDPKKECINNNVKN